jgi:hypothetical protein
MDFQDHSSCLLWVMVFILVAIVTFASTIAIELTQGWAQDSQTLSLGLEGGSSSHDVCPCCCPLVFSRVRQGTCHDGTRRSVQGSVVEGHNPPDRKAGLRPTSSSGCSHP